MTFPTLALERAVSLNPRRRNLLRRALMREPDPLAKLWLMPWSIMETPDEWQKDAISQLVTCEDDVLMCCSRGAGKTEVLSASAYVEAALGGFAMILSRSDRQALRVIERATGYHRRHNLVSLIKQNMHELRFANGGRILALPSSGDTIVGEHGVTLMALDEAARIKDEFYAVVTPMLIVSERVTGIHPRLALLSTPYGQRGFFWEEWEGRRRQSWKRHRYPWTECPRIAASDVEKERATHGDWWVQQEFELEFHPTVGSFFNVAAFEQCAVRPEATEHSWHDFEAQFDDQAVIDW